MTKKNRSLIVAMIIAIGIILLFQLHQSGKIKEVKKSETKNYDFNIKASELVKMDEFRKKYEVKNVKIEEDKPKRPIIPNIPMSEDKLDYLFERTNEENLSYELLLSIFMLESEQGTKKIHYNSNGSVDRGIFQINSGSIKGLAKEAGMENFNAMNDFDSINLAIQHLKDSRKYWIAQGMSEEEAYPYIIVNYNLGLAGTREYLKHHNIEDSKYFQVIRNYKVKFEMEENQ